MPTSHRTPAVHLLLSVLLAGGACAGIASAQATFEFTDSGQALGNGASNSVTLGDLDGDGGELHDQDRIHANRMAFPPTGVLRANHLCGTPEPNPNEAFLRQRNGLPAYYDPAYHPSSGLYRIPVVVHVIRNDDGTLGDLSLETVQSGIDILNEDFNAIPGTNGAPGNDARIEFYLADIDPDGNPTNGVTYNNNTTWHNNWADDGAYREILEWDIERYINVYTLELPWHGHAWFPWQGIHGVWVDWRHYGRDAPYGGVYNQGRTLTHEIGHYLGLYHTFQSGCGNSNCYGSGDFICDTNPQESPSGPGECTLGTSSCGSVDPIHNYMDYSTDLCKNNFTPEQILRMRYVLVHYRPLLYSIVTDCPADLDGNGAVDGADLAIVLGAWGSSDATANLTGDPLVDGADLAAILAAWGSCTQ